MRRLLIGLGMACIALPAWAQTQQQRDWCYGVAATADQTIAACTALIQTGKEPTASLAVEYLDRGIGYATNGHYDQAIADYTKAIAIKPDYVHAYSNRGFAYEKEGGHTAQAVADYRAALKLDPNNQTSKEGLKRLGATP